MNPVKLPPCLALHPHDQPPIMRQCRRSRDHAGNHRDAADGTPAIGGRTSEWPNEDDTPVAVPVSTPEPEPALVQVTQPARRWSRWGWSL